MRNRRDGARLHRLPVVSAALSAFLVAGLLALAGQHRPAKAAAAEAPIRAAFYYGWFPETEHWASKYTPAAGKYDSSDPAVVATQVRQAKAAGLNAFISSWWGQGTKTDSRLPLLLDTAAAQGFKVAPYFEREGFGNPTTTELSSDLAYLAAKAAAAPAWLRVGGRPVLFVYNADDTSCAVTDRWVGANQGRFYLQMKVLPGYQNCASQPDAWHQYGPASAIQQVLPWSVNVSPGFFKFDEASPRLARDLATFKSVLAQQVKSGAQWQLVTSWNEWGEGTGVEPTTQFGQAYTDAMTSAYTAVATTTPSPTGSTAAAAVALPAADSYVRSNAAGTNYGTATTLQQNATSTAVAVSYLRFPAPAATVAKATLRLFSRSSGITRTKVFSTSGTWDERALTWSNRPALGAQVGTTGTLTAGQWTEADVTAAVRAGGTSFGLTTSATATRYFDSRETANPPQLVLEYATGSSAPATSAAPTTSAPTTSAAPTSTAPTSTAPTSTAPATAPVVAAVGDIACAPGYTVGSSCQHKAVADKIISDTAVSRVLALGDLQYEAGALSAFLGSYDKSWGALKSKTKPVPGNHEYGTAGAAGYFDYFGALAGDRTKGYYSFDVGAWHFVALNSERDITSGGAQLAWLKADLAAHRNKCVGAMLHKPRWSTGTHGDNSAMAPFVQALYDAGAEVILSGHDHDYERFYPLNPSGVRDDARGIVQIVSGEGGKNHYAVAGRSTTAAKDNSSYGYARLVLHADRADVSFVPAVGSYRDAATIVCH